MDAVMGMEGKRTAIYCRVDRGGAPQARREALTAQRRALEEYTRAEGLLIVGQYEDDGFSGHDLHRPGLTELVRDGGAGAFEQVLVVSRGRLYRGSSWEEPRWPFRVRTLAPWE